MVALAEAPPRPPRQVGLLGVDCDDLDPALVQPQIELAAAQLA